VAAIKPVPAGGPTSTAAKRRRKTTLIRVLLGSRVQRFTGGRDGQLSMSRVAAVVVLVGWLVVPLLLGGWRTVTRQA
jgi:hypothetical protein